MHLSQQSYDSASGSVGYVRLLQKGPNYNEFSSVEIVLTEDPNDKSILVHGKPPQRTFYNQQDLNFSLKVDGTTLNTTTKSLLLDLRKKREFQYLSIHCLAPDNKLSVLWKKNQIAASSIEL